MTAPVVPAVHGATGLAQETEELIMATQATRTYAISAGLSCGVGVAAPLLVYAISTQIEALQGVVGASALPFAVGALSGAGVFALTARSLGLGAAQALPDAGFALVAGEQGTDRSEAAPGSGHRSQSDIVAEQDAERFFGRQGAPKGVPVIARAQNAATDQGVWDDIDELLRSDSPISCDPSRSKDIYEIALEELRGGSTPAQRPADEHASVSPDKTSVFLAAAQRAGIIADDLDEPDLGDGPADQAPAAGAPRADAGGAVEEEPETYTVPMADYSGHEDMWAAALDILEEDPRTETIEEGRRSNRFHEHVNSLIEEEFDRAASSTVRNTSREYLHVIQGGTTSFPRQQREA